MYENEIEVTVQLTLKVKVDSYSSDEDAMEAVFDEAEQMALSSINVDFPCSVEKEEVSSIEFRSSEYRSNDINEAA